jgi:hypothetical protein
MNAKAATLALLACSVAAMAAMSPRSAQAASVSPAEARAIAREAYIYGLLKSLDADWG